MLARWAVLFIFLISSKLFAQLPINEKLGSPRLTMHTFMEAMEKVKKGETEAINEAIITLDLTAIDSSLRTIVGKSTAERLVNTIDRIAKINYQNIPTKEMGPKWFFRKETISLNDKNFDVEIAIEKSRDGNWRFSSETVQNIEYFYASVSHLKVVEGVDSLINWRTKIKDQMPAWMSNETIILKNGQWIALAALFFISILAMFFSRKLIRLYIEGIRVSTLPFGLFIFSLTWFFGVRFLEFDFELLAFFMRATYILMAFSAVWSSLHIVDYLSLLFIRKNNKNKNKFDDVLIPLLRKATKVVVVSFGAILIAHSLTFDIASILAGLGIGGVAVAFAAKDTIANIFGSITVLIDRPFDIGDYVILDKGIEGTIEQVGFRSTRIRTPANSVVTVPNSILANMSIDNYGLRKYRRFKTSLCVKHIVEAEKLELFCQQLRKQFSQNELLVKDESLVYVYDINERAILVLINVFFDTNKYSIELDSRQKLICDILKLAAALEIPLASPQYI